MPMVQYKSKKFPTSHICSYTYDLRIYFLFVAMLLYRTQRNVRKQRLKLTHAGIMLFIILLMVIALVAVFDSHNLAPLPIPNMYSLHSWVGLTTVILFCCQVNLWNLPDNLVFIDIYVNIFLFTVGRWMCFLPLSRIANSITGFLYAIARIFWHCSLCGRNCFVLVGT